MPKLTVNLSQTARERIDTKSAELGLTRSRYIERLVSDDAKAELEKLLEEGYRATSSESLEFAEQALPIFPGQT